MACPTAMGNRHHARHETSRRQSGCGASPGAEAVSSAASVAAGDDARVRLLEDGAGFRFDSWAEA